MYGVSFSLKCMITAGSRAHFDSLSGEGTCTSTSQSSAIKMFRKASHDATTWLERWHFLKELPDRIIRDIGFVISSPPILVDSQELPMVSPDMLGGGFTSWLDSTNWLASLDVDQVKQWFEAKSNNGRLGEHFAFCVEYVLLFSPFSKARNLMTFKQVTSRTGDTGSQPPVTGKETSLSIALEAEKEQDHNTLNDAKTARLGIPERSVQSPVDTMEGIMNIQELMAQYEDEACEPEKLEIVQGEGKNNKIGKRKKKLLRKMQRLRDGKGVTVTIGEFDFLFEDAVKQDKICSHSQVSREVTVTHWEASVKFLLYAGPWEMFGFETPNNAAWHSLNKQCGEEVDCQKDGGFQYTINWHANMFLDCFLGPHVGETLYNRKTRLINQLALSQNVHAASLLCNCFGLRPDGRIFTSFSTNQSNGQLDENIDKTHERQHGDVLQIFPRALLTGYLFYEYELWCQLYPEKVMGQQVNRHLEILNRETLKRDSYVSCEAKVNPEHWMGWWTRACNFANFARLPVHKCSKWYIVPKLEWLSPVVIDGKDGTRGKEVLSLDEFLIVAEKVAVEAERTNISRKRRFMVAEVVWEPPSASHCALDQIALRGQWDGSSEGRGRWTEVSRGFVVEDTWPDSRLYRPHGYRLSSLPGHC
ncbi:hypothetical protein L7F22_009956 [Adiantum nelumboides]|nr:hypothetical protein [Adiantum nelumboides]